MFNLKSRKPQVVSCTFFLDQQQRPNVRDSPLQGVFSFFITILCRDVSYRKTYLQPHTHLVKFLQSNTLICVSYLLYGEAQGAAWTSGRLKMNASLNHCCASLAIISVKPDLRPVCMAQLFHHMTHRTRQPANRAEAGELQRMRNYCHYSSSVRLDLSWRPLCLLNKLLQSPSASHSLFIAPQLCKRHLASGHWFK